MSKSDAREFSAVPASMPWLFEELNGSTKAEETLDFRDLLEVSDALMAGYMRLARKGAAKESVGVAMLCAAINIYDVFEMRSELPDLLRGLASRIESDAEEPAA